MFSIFSTSKMLEQQHLFNTTLGPSPTDCAFQIFPGAHGVPLARLGGATIDAKLDELRHGVGLCMVVAGLVTS